MKKNQKLKQNLEIIQKRYMQKFIRNENLQFVRIIFTTNLQQTKKISYSMNKVIFFQFLYSLQHEQELVK